jgi:hypothetical protein
MIAPHLPTALLGAAALAFGCGGPPPTPLEALADSVRRHHELPCNSPRMLPLAKDDEVVHLTRQVCQTPDMFEHLSRSTPNDTAIIIRYGAGNRVLRVIRMWMPDGDAAAVLGRLREHLSAVHGPPRICSEPNAAGVREYYVWRAPELLVQVSAISPDRSIYWFVGLPPGGDDCGFAWM